MYMYTHTHTQTESWTSPGSYTMIIQNRLHSLSCLLFPLLESVPTSKVYRFITNCSVLDTKFKQASQCKPNSSNLQLHLYSTDPVILKCVCDAHT